MKKKRYSKILIKQCNELRQLNHTFQEIKILLESQYKDITVSDVVLILTDLKYSDNNK